jgi:hypothetical protein
VGNNINPFLFLGGEQVILMDTMLPGRDDVRTSIRKVLGQIPETPIGFNRSSFGVAAVAVLRHLDVVPSSWGEFYGRAQAWEKIVSDAEVVPDETLFEVYNKSVGRYMSVDADPVAHSPFDDSEEVTLDETPRRRKEDPNEGTYKRLAYREGHAIVTSADSWARLQENLNCLLEEDAGAREDASQEIGDFLTQVAKTPLYGEPRGVLEARLMAYPFLNEPRGSIGAQVSGVRNGLDSFGAQVTGYKGRVQAAKELARAVETSLRSP